MQKSQEVSPRRVLVVEDDATIAETASMLLKHYGYNVDVAPTLAEARTRLRTGPDWVFLDLNLPDGRGESLLADMARTTRKPPKVLIFTGCTETSRMDRLERTNPGSVFRKPAAIFDIINFIRTSDASPAGK